MAISRSSLGACGSVVMVGASVLGTSVSVGNFSEVFSPSFGLHLFGG